MLKQADDDSYKIGMERALKTCDGARAALVDMFGVPVVKKQKFWPW